MKSGTFARVPRARATHRIVVAVVAGAWMAAAVGGEIRLEVGPVGATVVDSKRIGGGYSSISVPSRGKNAAGTWDGITEGVAYQDSSAGVKARIAGTLAATAQAKVDNDIGRFMVTPPEGVNFAGGKLVLYAAMTGGNIEGNGTLTFGFSALARRFSWPVRPQASVERTITDGPGGEDVEVSITLDLPTSLDSTSYFDLDTRLVLAAAANIAPSGGNLQSAAAEALKGGRIIGFRMFNAAGVQLPGFTAEGAYSKLAELPPAPAGRGIAVEFYNADFNHFFITANTAEIAGLDAGTAWRRTGESFGVYTTAASGSSAVCRFFAEFPPKSSHFYALRGLGCEALLANPGPWRYEGDVFFMPPPAADGACPTGTIPVFRLYNQGMGGAPNHRYTTSQETAAEMVRDGYVSEGAGEAGVAMCSPK